MPTRTPDPTDSAVKDGLLRLVAPLPRRPSEAFDNVARNEVHPGRVLVRRLREAAQAGVPVTHARAVLRDLADRLADAVWHDAVQRLVNRFTSNRAA
jgi:hypothetical protein